MANLRVPPDYVEGFLKADNTFLYQLVFDPMMRRIVPLNPYPPQVDPTQLDYAGPYPFIAMNRLTTRKNKNFNATGALDLVVRQLSDDRALSIALGNVCINTGKPMGDFNPDTFKV